MKKTLLGVLCTFFLFSLFAQVPQRINSANLIEQGNQLHNSGKYKEAVNIYRQVPRNDTNYIKSLYETVLTQLADTAYAEALKTCEAALALDDMEYELRLLLAYGTINDDMGNSSRAMHIYDSTLKKYPNASDIWFNKGVTYMRQKKINEATEIFKTLLVKNPYYSSAHFRLAQCAVQQGQMVPAMYSLLTYLLVSPSGIHYKNAINLLDNIAKNTEEVKAYQTKPADPAFNTAQTILLSKIALDKGYKVQADLDDPIVRQLQVVLEKVQYQAGSNNFWMQYYVPLFADLWSKKLFEPVIFYALSNVNLEPINRYNKKNEKTINSATSQIGDYLNTIRQTRELTLAKRTAAERQYHFSNGELAGKGKIDSREELVGPWTFYFSNGNVKSTGRFNDKGEKEGTWKYYYANGVLGGVDNWISGKQTGEDIIYNRNGIVTGHAYYKNGQLEGDKKSFYAIGHPFSTLQYKEGKENGTQVRYYSNGKKRVEAQVKDDAFDGVYKSFYKNGQPEVVAHYSSGKLHGSYQSFYNNGQLSFSTTYNNGLLEGAATGYHIKGKVKRTQTFIADKLDGEELEYNNSGILVQKARYSKGKVQGAAEYFDDDGKLYSIFDFDKDVIKQVRYFDKSGKEISRSLSQRGQIQVTNYNPGGFKTSAITYNDAAEKINSDTYYYTSGKTKETNQYQKGKLHGISVGYHPNGKKSFEINYANDEKNGLITYYHMDGTLKSYGWYDADVLNDDWVNFNEKGKITSRTTYLDDEIIGIKETFFPDGRLDDEEVYENGWLKAVHQYDSLGNKIHSSHFVNGNGTLRYVHFNGKTSV
ncbi:MAG: tetratricopeptide repeat protein, partial [Chitinophagaceae bacterium]